MKRAFVLRVSVALALLACACNGTSDRATLSSASVRAPAPSIYPLRLALHDDRGAPIALDAFRGHPVMISMFYGTCPMACPLLVTNMKQAEAALSPAARADTRVMLVSFDPEHDTPDVLGAIARRHAMDTSRWKLATGPDDDVRQLSGALDIPYRKMQGGGFSHASVIVVLDREGRIALRTEDPAGDVKEIAEAITAISVK